MNKEMQKKIRNASQKMQEIKFSKRKRNRKREEKEIIVLERY